jgi:hypothetical protein
MRRNSPLRFWLSISGIIAAVVLAAAGGLLLWGSACESVAPTQAA